MARKYMNKSEAAAYLGVHPTTIIRWEDSGRLVGYRSPGMRRMYRQEDLDKVMTSPEQSHAQNPQDSTSSPEPT
jgi:excisionase family DNA binding protein